MSHGIVIILDYTHKIAGKSIDSSLNFNQHALGAAAIL